MSSFKIELTSIGGILRVILMQSIAMIFAGILRNLTKRALRKLGVHYAVPTKVNGKCSCSAHHSSAGDLLSQRRNTINSATGLDTAPANKLEVIKYRRHPIHNHGIPIAHQY